MKIVSQALRIGLSALALGTGLTTHMAAFGQPVITSFSGNGALVCSNLAPGSVATVEWASSLAGPWQTNWTGLGAVTADSNGAIAVSVPMFYRVRGTNPPPPGMFLIPAGAFTMGDTLDGESDAIPTSVHVSAFYMDTNLVSYTLWTNVYQWATSHGYSFEHAGAGKAGNHPVQTVDWYDVVKWCNARSQQAGLRPVYYTDAGFMQVYTNGDTDAVSANWSANGYRLPTEAEWEKAARGGRSGERFPWGNTISESQANYYSYWYDDAPYFAYDVNSYSGYNINYNTGGYPYTSPVGSFAPNGNGLYDMAGNVWEWCWDWYGTPYGQPTTTNPIGPLTGSHHVLRGGSWYVVAFYSRCAYRDYGYPDYAVYYVGVRCVRGF